MKQLLLAVGVGARPTSNATAAAAASPTTPSKAPDASPAGADVIAPGTDEWEALLRERVRHEVATKRALDEALQRCVLQQHNTAAPFLVRSCHTAAVVCSPPHGHDRAAMVAMIEEERDAWKASTRQLESALTAMSARCADLEYVLANIPGGTEATRWLHRRSLAAAGRRFPQQPAPDLSTHGCPKCSKSTVLII